MAELDVSLAVCNAAIRAWDAGPERPMIINLPTTVEVSTPNVFADQIEWMDRRLERREHIVLSVHPHNDRGTRVACAEQALLAGAQRVEGRRSEEHTSELQSLMRISYAVFCLKKNIIK